MTPEELKAATERAKRVEAWRYGDAEARQTAQDFLALVADYEKTKSDYQFMVDRAGEEHLDGYRALGARVAAAEEDNERLQAALDAALDEIERAIVRSSPVAPGMTLVLDRVVNALGDHPDRLIIDDPHR